MNRLIVTNSALAYPPPPASLAGPGDAVLPLVETFEEALFMPSDFYEGFWDQIVELNREARSLARRMGDLLPAALSQPRPEWGHSAWEVFADSFVKFSLGPVLVNSLLAERAAALKPREVIAWEEPANPSWWSGRQMVAETARDIAEATGARLTVRAGPLRRAAMQVARAPATCAQARLRFLRRIAGPAQRAAGRSDVVFTIVSATLTPIFERVGQFLAEQHGLRVLGLEVPLTHFARGIGGQLLPKANLHAYATPGMLARANLEVFSSWTWQAHFRRAFAGFEGLAQLGRGVRAVLVRRMHNALIRDLPLAMYYSRLWSRFLEAVQPAAVVTFNAYNETIAPGVLQANARGLATLCCQEGVWGPYQLAAAVSPYDDLLVFGEYAAEIMQQVAAPRTRFTVTGHSLYDYTTWAPAAPAASSGGDRQAGGSHRPQVLATTQPIDERFVRAEPCWWVEALADACAELGARLLVKPHPQEVDLHLHSAVARRLPDVVTIVPHGERPLDQLIADCDALVTRFSTTAVEANLRGKPVLTINLSAQRDLYPYAQDGGALGVYRTEDILPALRRVLTDAATRAELAQSRRQFLQRHLGPLDGRATERMAEVIAERVAAARSA